jgi:hypothetical protein
MALLRHSPRGDVMRRAVFVAETSLRCVAGGTGTRLHPLTYQFTRLPEVGLIKPREAASASEDAECFP